MSQPSKHLLEAFNATSIKPASQAPRAAGAPLPSLAGAGSGSSTASLFDAPTSPRGILLQPKQLGLLAAVAFLAVVCSFLLGRASVGSVTANETDPSEALAQEATLAPEIQPPVAPPSAAVVSPEDLDRQARSAAELALLDKRNVYTIKLLEYARSETNTARAFETLRYLTDQAGLPACLTSTTSRILVLVGAGATQSELDQLLRRCKTIAGPPPLSKTAEFHDAYVDKIDKLFPRKN